MSEKDDDELRRLLKLGEFSQRRGDSAAAAAAFRHVAQRYADDGFFLKAIALTKQVLKLNPRLIDLYATLAEWHHTIGLLGEARGYLATAISSLLEAGRHADAIALEARFLALGISRSRSVVDELLQAPKARA